MTMPETASIRWALRFVLSALTILIFGFGGVYDWVWCSVTAAAIVAALLVGALQLREHRPLTWDPLFIPALLFFGLVALQWLLHTTSDRAASLTALVELAGLGALTYLAATGLRTARGLRKLGAWSWALAGMLGFEAIAQAFSANGRIYWFHDASYATPVGPFVYHNHFAGCAELLLPLAFVHAFRRERKGNASLSALVRGLCPALLIAALVVSASRGGVFIVALELAGMAVYLRPRSLRFRIQPIWVLAGMAALTILLVGWGPLARRLGVLGRHDPSVHDRMQVSLTCLQMFRSAPWLGTGMASFPSVYPSFERFDPGQIFLQAHDEYAQALAETGVAGAGLILAFLGILFWRWSALGLASADLDFRLSRAAALGAGALLLHSSFDFEFHAPALAALFFVLAIAARRPFPPQSNSMAMPIRHRRPRPVPLDA